MNAGMTARDAACAAINTEKTAIGSARLGIALTHSSSDIASAQTL